MFNKVYSVICYLLSFVYSVPLKNCLEKIENKIWYYGQKRFYGKKLKACGENLNVMLNTRIKGVKYISIGNSFKLGKHSILEAWDFHNQILFSPQILIGDNVSIGEYCHLGCINSIIIDDNVLLGSNVMIIDHSHGKSNTEDFLIAPNQRVLYSKGKIHIESGVWIGEKVSVLPNVTIGKNSIIGANSVVTHDIPPNCVASGNPALVLKVISPIGNEGGKTN